MVKSMAIMLANGFEEVEFSLPFDLCYRAGFDITLVAVPGEDEIIAPSLRVVSSHQLEIQAHVTLKQFLDRAEYPDVVFLPGGMPGSVNLAKNPYLIKFLKDYGQDLEPQQRYIAGICAAPAYVLGKACGLLKKYTCYPGAEKIVPENSSAIKLEQRLVEDRHILTADGVGSAHLLGEVLIRRLMGAEQAEQVMKAVLYR